MLSLELTGVDAWRAQLGGLARQLPAAVAQALTGMAQDVRQAEQQAMASVFDRPTPFTVRGIYVKPANREQLVAEVGLMDKQASYLRVQVEGGQRAPARRAIVLPSDIRRDAYGNINRADLRRLIALAKAGKGVGKRAAKLQGRTGVRAGEDLFYGTPEGGQPGLYKRVERYGKTHLVALVIFRREPTSYRRRFDFDGIALATVNRVAAARLDRAVAEAIAAGRAR